MISNQTVSALQMSLGSTVDEFGWRFRYAMESLRPERVFHLLLQMVILLDIALVC